MAGGRQWMDACTVAGRDVVTPFAIVRPSAPADDPLTSVYTTWAAAHAALLATEAPLKQLYIDSAGVAVQIPGQAWDMRGIAIVGFQASDLGVLGRQLLLTQDGCTFVGWTEGCENCSLVHNSATPLVTSVIAAPNIFTMRTGQNAIWAASGVGPVVLLNGTGGLRIDIESGGVILGDTPGFSPVLELTAAGGEYELIAGPGCSITDQALAGPGGTTINIIVTGAANGELNPTQPGFAGTLAIAGGADSLAWPLGPADANFNAPGPQFAGDALTRLAAAVAGLLGGPIP